MAYFDITDGVAFLTSGYRYNDSYYKANEQKHTYKDWGVYLKSYPQIGAPSFNSGYIEIPSLMGAIDLTDALTGRTIFHNRDAKIELTCLNPQNAWASVRSEIMNFIHGRTMKMVCDCDPAYYYEGRFAFDTMTQNSRTATITLTGDVYPYKRAVQSVNEDWLWDSFSFEDGCISYEDATTDYNQPEFDGTNGDYNKLTIEANGTLFVDLFKNFPDSEMIPWEPIVPSITVHTTGVSLYVQRVSPSGAVESTKYTCNYGMTTETGLNIDGYTWRKLKFSFAETATEDATITISFRRGRL